MTLKDRLTRGFLAGVMAGTAQSCITLPMYAFGKIKVRWLDFASVIVFGKRPKDLSQVVYSELMTLGWSGLLGIGYTYALPKVSERNHRFKGLLFGMSSWFSIYSVVQLLDVGKLMRPDKDTVLVHGASAAVWGFVMDESLNRMEQWTKQNQQILDSSTQKKDVQEIGVKGE